MRSRAETQKHVRRWNRADDVEHWLLKFVILPAIVIIIALKFAGVWK